MAVVVEKPIQELAPTRWKQDIDSGAHGKTRCDSTDARLTLEKVIQRMVLATPQRSVVAGLHFEPCHRLVRDRNLTTNSVD
jgi:hypothetical protein